ncbi:hypothetical protein [Streptomyces bambusae]|uniref:Poly(3-hydroxyalkanoate) polymerase subunit PhaE n=1 Tax=Streptomyces bambusae TaxID=1550616 RepID=A0ABS6Z6E6_9ACTN|nr:hypothetical protein [Streptomyces bambusae]MBW5483317.1 hypothetical protein [Streptomyces bambusae]
MNHGFWGHGGAYQTWADHLRDWAENGAAATAGAAAALPVLRPQDYAPDTWVRIADLLVSAIDRRLRAWAQALTTAMEEAGDEFGTGRALVQSRTGLQAVRDLAGHPSLPEELRQQLGELVTRQVEDFQRQLEEQLDLLARGGTDPRFVEARRRTLRENPLAAPPPGPGPAAAGGTAGGHTSGGWSYDPAAPARRRIITD